LGWGFGCGEWGWKVGMVECVDGQISTISISALRYISLYLFIISVELAHTLYLLI
jgi:hypothetical protein